MALPKLQSMKMATIRCLLALCVFGLLIGPQMVAERDSQRAAIERAELSGHTSEIALERGRRASFAIEGRVRGLYPGARKPLWLRLINPNRFPIKVRKLRAMVLESNHDGCGSRWIRPKRRVSLSLRVPGKSRALASYPIRMRKATPQACSGAKWKLRFRARGKRP